LRAYRESYRRGAACLEIRPAGIGAVSPEDPESVRFTILILQHIKGKPDGLRFWLSVSPPCPQICFTSCACSELQEKQGNISGGSDGSSASGGLGNLNSCTIDASGSV
jgi:hypothetical protein